MRRGHWIVSRKIEEIKRRHDARVRHTKQDPEAYDDYRDNNLSLGGHK